MSRTREGRALGHYIRIGNLERQGGMGGGKTHRILRGGVVLQRGADDPEDVHLDGGGGRGGEEGLEGRPEV